MFHFTEHTQVIDFVVFFGSFYVYVPLFLKYIYTYPMLKHTLQSQVLWGDPFGRFSASVFFTEQRNRTDIHRANTMILNAKNDVAKHGTNPKQTEQEAEHDHPMGSLQSLWLRNRATRTRFDNKFMCEVWREAGAGEEALHRAHAQVELCGRHRHRLIGGCE